LRLGSKFVFSADNFRIEGWEPDETVKLPEPEQKAGGYLHYHTVYLWRIGGRRVNPNG
jgi:hypothetical protein